MYEKYRVSGKRRIVEAISNAFEQCGVQILKRPDHRSAPFEFDLLLPEGERVSVICYAFLANEYLQGGRPEGEHRFQIKYGSEFDRPHHVYIDESRDAITLFIGVHLEEGIFVGVDPAMHNPTWFSSSIEFKSEHVRKARTTGWYCWERERSASRRRAGREAENYQTESVVGFCPGQMLKYLHFEKLATGLDAGERSLIAEKIGSNALNRELQHPLEIQFGLPAHEILDVIWGRFRLEVAVRGGVAEHHLGKFLRAHSGISRVTDIDEDGRPDFEIELGSQSLLVECKNVLRKLPKDGRPRVDFQKTRAAKDNPCSRYYDARSFDVLAACLYPITERWEFRFVRTCALPPHAHCQGKLSERVIVDEAVWATDPVRLVGSTT